MTIALLIIGVVSATGRINIGLQSAAPTSLSLAYLALLLIGAAAQYAICRRTLSTVAIRNELYVVPTISRSVLLSASLRRQLESECFKQPLPPPAYTPAAATTTMATVEEKVHRV